MSLFGGDTPPPADSSGSEFSISPISSPERRDLQTSPQEVQDHAHTADALPSDFDTLEADDVQAEDEIDQAGFDTSERITDGHRTRYQGSDSLYRYHTRRERTLYSSLEQLQANDLSLHLYNAHAWKARLRSRDEYTAKGPFRRKSAWIPGGKEQGSKEWYPDQIWTSWPLEPNLVPRPGEDFGVPKATRREMENDLRINGWKTREELQEDVFGLLMGQAKESWNSRPRATSPIANRNVSPGITREHRSSRSPSLGREDARHGHQSDDPEIDPKHESELEEGPLGSVPVMSGDDDHLRSILRPTANHVLSRLDDLLMALHHNRNGQYRNEWDNNAEGSRSRSHSRGPKRRRPLNRTRSAEDQNHDTDAAQSGYETEAAESRSRSHSRKRHKTTDSTPSDTRRERSSSVASSAGSDHGLYHRNPRDWSEVLGLATLIGWNEAALQRTLQRCADLFGEDMQLHSVDNPSIALRSETTRPTPDAIDEHAIPVAAPANTLAQQLTEGAYYICPFVDCARHSLPYPSSQGYRFREHLRRAHKFSAARIRNLEEEMQVVKKTASSTKSNPRGWVAPDPLVCPFPSCRRAQEPFPASNRLVEHLVRAHKWNPRKEPPPPTLPAQNNDAGSEPPSGQAAPWAVDSDSDDEIVGGVHNDGFMQPLNFRKG